MPTITALTTLDGREKAEALGAQLEDLDPAPTGVGVFEIEDGSGLWEVGAYFQSEPSDVALDLLAAAFGARPFSVSTLPEIDWVAKVRRELAPVEAGRFFVYGSHDAKKIPEGSISLLIEASMAFGTGHHGTTLGCLKAFDALLNDGGEPGPVADLGCGTAVLAMAAAKMWSVPIVAGDIDEVAVEVAQANLVANGLNDNVVCVEAAGLNHPRFRDAGEFALVFANILKAPLITLAPDIVESLADGGRAILSGILVEQAEEIIAVYSRFGTNLERREDIGDWSCLTMRKNPQTTAN